MSLADFDAWFAEHRDRTSRVPGYEHAMYMHWYALERANAELTRERDGLLDVIAQGTREHTDLRAELAGAVR